MKAPLRTTVVLAALCLVGAASAQLSWLGSWAKAMKASKQTGRPVLALFTGSDWCVPCKRLESEILDTPVFQSWAKQHVVLLKLDYPQHHPQPADVKAANMQLAQRYNVSAFPTIVIVSSSGQVLTKQAGYNPVGPSFWTKSTEAVLSNRSRG